MVISTCQLSDINTSVALLTIISDEDQPKLTHLRVRVAKLVPDRGQYVADVIRGAHAYSFG